MKIKIIYEVSTITKDVAKYDNLNEAREFALLLLKTDVKKYESVFIHQRIYVDGRSVSLTMIDHFYNHSKGFEWCFIDQLNDCHHDFFLKEESND